MLYICAIDRRTCCRECKGVAFRLVYMLSGNFPAPLMDFAQSDAGKGLILVGGEAAAVICPILERAAYISERITLQPEESSTLGEAMRNMSTAPYPSSTSPACMSMANTSWGTCGRTALMRTHPPGNHTVLQHRMCGRQGRHLSIRQELRLVCGAPGPIAGIALSALLHALNACPMAQRALQDALKPLSGTSQADCADCEVRSDAQGTLSALPSHSQSGQGLCGESHAATLRLWLHRLSLLADAYSIRHPPGAASCTAAIAASAHPCKLLDIPHQSQE